MEGSHASVTAGWVGRVEMSRAQLGVGVEGPDDWNRMRMSVASSMRSLKWNG